MDSLVDINQFINSKGEDVVAPHTIIAFNGENDNITELESLTAITSKNTFTIVVFKNPTFDTNLNFLYRFKAIQRLQINMKIGFFFSQSVSMKDLWNLFQWCKEQLIVNVFAATLSHSEIDLETSAERILLSIFTFDAFGAFDVINVTASATYKNYFLSLNSNFQQHQLLLGKPYQYPMDEYLWSTVFHMMNATSTIDNNNYTMYYELQENGIDIVPWWFVGEHAKHFKVYPLLMVPQIVIVPQALPYTDFSSYLQVITKNSFFLFSFIVIAALMVFLTVVRYIKEKNFLFLQSVVDIGNILMNDNGYIKYQQLSRAEVFVITPLTFVGFVIVNWIISYLQSYLTQPILQPQIRSTEEIYESPYPIATNHEYWKEELTDAFNNRSKQKDWNEKIIVLERKQYYEQLFAYNASTSYYVNEIDANTIFKFQKNTNIRGYYDPRIQIAVFPLTYLVNEKFLYLERLNYIIHWTRSVGLFEHWLKTLVEENRKIVLQKYFDRLTREQGTDVERFQFPMVIVYGWIVSTIVLILEIIWKNIETYRVKFGKKIKHFFRVHAKIAVKFRCLKKRNTRDNH